MEYQAKELFAKHDVPVTLGIVAHTPDDWYRHIRALLTDQALRARLASNGRRLVEQRYSLEAQAPTFVEVVRSVMR